MRRPVICLKRQKRLAEGAMARTLSTVAAGTERITASEGVNDFVQTTDHQQDALYAGAMSLMSHFIPACSIAYALIFAFSHGALSSKTGLPDGS